MIGVNVFAAYEALDRMDGHLTDWNVGLFRASRSKVAEAQNGDSETSEVVAIPAEGDDKPDQPEAAPTT